MGLYNNVKCEYVLPGASIEIQNGTFQTKDFECLLDDYTITKDGKLIHHIYEGYVVPEEERPHYGTPEWDKGGLFHLMGSLGRKATEDKKINYHGIINIYTIASNNEWWEYKIKFTDGKVTNVKKINKDL